jgi:hypothetical protein
VIFEKVLNGLLCPSGRETSELVVSRGYIDCDFLDGPTKNVHAVDKLKGRKLENTTEP